MLKKSMFLSFFLFSLFTKTVFTEENLKNEEKKIEFHSEVNEKKLPEMNFRKSFFKMIFALFAIIVLSFLTFYAFKKISSVKIENANKQKAIKIIEKRVLSPKSILYLIEYEGIKTLISESHLDIKMKILK